MNVAAWLHGLGQRDELRHLARQWVQKTEAIGAARLLRLHPRGQATAAPPNRVMNSRRLIRSPRRRARAAQVARSVRAPWLS
jgi:hypothetical protein